MTISLEMISQNIFNKYLFWSDVLYFQLSLNAMTSSWWFKVGHDGSIHTRTIAKYYKLHSPSLEEVVKYLPAHHSYTSNKTYTDRTNLSSQTSSTTLGFLLIPLGTAPLIPFNLFTVSASGPSPCPSFFSLPHLYFLF